MKTAKTLFSFLAVLLIIALTVLNLRYAKLNEPIQYKGKSAVQRIDRFTKTTEVFYDNKWISLDNWKTRIDDVVKNENPQTPSWKTPSLEPFNGETKPVLGVNRGKPSGQRTPVQQAKEVVDYHQKLSNQNQQ